MAANALSERLFEHSHSEAATLKLLPTQPDVMTNLGLNLTNNGPSASTGRDIIIRSLPSFLAQQGG